MLSFVALSILGAFLLSMPFANSNNEWREFIPSFFMSVSATCVTGLAVVDVGQDFSFWGQLVILFLMQIGGLSYMTITTILVYLVGKKLSISETKIFDLSNNSESKVDFASFVIRIAVLTFTIEALGVAFLLKDSIDIVQTSFVDLNQSEVFVLGLFQAVFHSVSAFCNAGLSLYPGSLEHHSQNYWMLWMFSILPIVGGLGYTVLTELYTKIGEQFSKSRQAKNMLSLHTKVSLTTTIALLIVGILIQLCLIYAQNLESLVSTGLDSLASLQELWHNFWVAFFQSSAARSSGFNSYPLTELGDPSLVFLIVWMFIGACPGGTGGGIKVTTLIVVFAMMLAGLKSKKEVRIFNRSINMTYQQRALIVFISTSVMIIFFTFLISIWESPKDIRFIDQLFEVTSAFTTVGLSTGITSSLDHSSQLILCACMIIGRPGPLLFLMSFVEEKLTRQANYPEENILIG